MTRSKFAVFSAANPRILPGFDGEDAVTMEKVNAAIKAAVPDVNKIVKTEMENLQKNVLPKLITDSLAPTNTALTGIQDVLKTIQAGSGGGDGEDKNKQVPPEMTAKVKNLEETLASTNKIVDQMKNRAEEAERRAETTEMHGKIRNALGTLEYASPKAAETAFSTIVPLVKKLDDGTLIGGDNLPIEDFVKDFIPKEHPYLLKPTGASGAGAGAGGSGGGRGAGTATTEMIRAGMTPAERALVVAKIVEVGASARA